MLSFRTNEKVGAQNISVSSRFFEYQYHIGFTVVALAIFGPYLIQYSTMMNALHNKDLFKSEKFSKLSCQKRICLRLTFTALGVVIMPLFEVFKKIEAVIRLLSLACCCRNG